MYGSLTQIIKFEVTDIAKTLIYKYNLQSV